MPSQATKTSAAAFERTVRIVSEQATLEGGLTVPSDPVGVVLFAPGFVNVVLNADEAYVATQAQVLDAGGDLYVDVTDRKPPLVPPAFGDFFGSGYTNASTFDTVGRQYSAGVRFLF